MWSSAQVGFTKVELIVAVVVFGMVAAVAVPRYRGFEAEARVAAVKNMGGKLKSAALMAHTVCQAQSCANDQTIVIQGQSITFLNGYPDAASIGRLVPDAEGFTRSAAGNRFVKDGAGSDNCWVQYNNASSAADVVSPPTISYQSGTIINQATEQSVNAALRTQC
jgi:type II secretory pathway pseudopilin PulG